MKYFVDKEAGIVKATIDNCDKDVYKLVLKRAKNPYLFNPVVLYEVLKLKKKYVGVAKCAPDDVFNEEIGRIMAARRASLKYEKDRTKALHRFMEHFFNLMEVEEDQEERERVARVREEDSHNIVDIYEDIKFKDIYENMKLNVEN